MILYAKHPTRNDLKRQILIDSHGFHRGMCVPNFPAKSRIPIMQCFGCMFVSYLSSFNLNKLQI